MKKQETVLKKLALLQFINERKSVLFGSFSGNKLSHSEKEASWAEVLEKAKSLGFVNENRSWTYVRDTLFGVWKSRALAKRDNARKTGTAGGVDKKFDEIDTAIFDIIDSESVLDGLNLIESDGTGSSIHIPNLPVQTPINANIPATTSTTEKEYVPKKKLKLTNIENLETEKNNLKNHLLKLEIYKQKLEIFKLEKELQVPSSEFTQDIVDRIPQATNFICTEENIAMYEIN